MISSTGILMTTCHSFNWVLPLAGNIRELMTTVRSVLLRTIAVHARSFRPCRYTTYEECLACQHRFMSDWKPDKSFAETLPPYIQMWKRT
ncbi:hypothetical protein AAE250_21010 [Bacteroides sp. GD17]|uniref:hypothetical protein n=1 Tax=Bacteroides sp. GD17 TaxID=3139826 RepID=UPI0025FDB6FF|nr:hypothetical protein [uncultured Bacteroides sp.]